MAHIQKGFVIKVATGFLREIPVYREGERLPDMELDVVSTLEAATKYSTRSRAALARRNGWVAEYQIVHTSEENRS